MQWDLYARLSVARDGQTETVERQERDMRRDVAVRTPSDEIGRVYVDNDLSAWNEDVWRDAFEKMLEAIADGTSASGIMFWHSDRMYRQMWDLERLIRAGKKRGLIFRQYGHGQKVQTWDLSDAEDRENLRQKCIKAQGSSEDTSRRVKEHHRDRVEFGNKPLQKSYGYTVDGEIIEAEAAVLREAARRWLGTWNGDASPCGRPGFPSKKKAESWSDIVADFDRRGIRTTKRGERGGIPFSRVSLRVAVLRPINGGDISLNGEVLGHLTTPIFTAEEWADITTTALHAKRGKPQSPKYQLTGLVFCECGKQMSGATLSQRRQRIRDENGSTRARRVYRCVMTPENRCCAQVTAEHVEAIVEEYVLAALANPDYRSRLIEARVSDDDETRAVVAEIERVGIALAELSVNFGLSNGGMPESAYRAASMRLSTRQSQLQARLAELSDPARKSAQETAQALAQWHGVELSDDERREQRADLIRAVVRRIVIHPPKKAGPFGAFDSDRVEVFVVESDAMSSEIAASA